MSLLDNGPDVVTVYSEVETIDHRGSVVREPSSTGVVVRGLMQPSTTDVDVAQGQRTTVEYKLICRSAPIGAWSRIEWEGRRFSVLEQPRAHDGTNMIKHVTAVLREER